MHRELGAFETAQVITGEHSPFNAVIVLRLANGPAPEDVTRALATLQNHHPLLSVRVVADGRRRVFATREVPAIPTDVVERTSDDQWRSVVEHELNRTLDLSVGPPLRCVMLSPESGNLSEIVLTFHHSVMDSVAGTTLLRQLLTLCDPTSAPPAFSAPSDDLPPASDALFPAASRGFSRVRRLASFIIRQMADEVRYRLGSRGFKSAAIPETARCRILTAELEPTTTRALARKARIERVGLNSVLSAAELVAVWRRRYGETARPLRYITFADLRPYLEPKVPAEITGSHISMLRFTMGLKPQRSFWEIAAEISAQTQAAFRRGDKFTSAILSPGLMRMILRMETMRMASSALSYSGPTHLERRFGPTALNGVHAFVSNLRLGPEFTALARLDEGRLMWDIVYLDGDMNPTEARAIADEILEILRLAAKE